MYMYTVTKWKRDNAKMYMYTVTKWKRDSAGCTCVKKKSYKDARVSEREEYFNNRGIF